MERLRNYLNPPRVIYQTYQTSKRWEFDASSFKAPSWHTDINGKFGAPIVDVNLKVCHLPEIACADFYGALVQADEDSIFAHPVVRASLNWTWWQGAYKFDLLQLALTCIGLLLMISDQWLGNFSHDHDERELSTFFVHTGVGTNMTNASAAGFFSLGEVSIAAANFIGARGFVDLGLELVQLAGYLVSGHCGSYCNLGNALDLLRALLSIAFYFSDYNDILHVLVVVIYWFRLLEVSFSENLMRELLPITQLVRGLAPSLVVCAIAVCAFTHAKWSMSAEPLWPNAVYQSFALLITAGLPPSSDSNPQLIFSFFAVSSFSVFFLNIFISVICENYTAEKQAAPLSFQKKKCVCCLTFLVRSEALPCRLMSQRVATAVSYLAFLLALASIFLAHMTMVPGKHHFRMSLWFISMSLAMLVCFQDPEETWSRLRNQEAPRYVWIATKTTFRAPTKQDSIEQTVEQLTSELQELQKLVAAKTCSEEASAD